VRDPNWFFPTHSRQAREVSLREAYEYLRRVRREHDEIQRLCAQQRQAIAEQREYLRRLDSTPRFPALPEEAVAQSCPNEEAHAGE